MQYAMFLVMRDIRRRSNAEELAGMLGKRLDTESETFAVNDRNARFGLHGMNGPQIHRLLARMTDYLETQSGQASRYVEYAQRGRKGYEIEHIWADHSERHVEEFAHPSEFTDYRNHIGGLLLLPKSFNASYGDLHYAEKRGYYLEQNLLARSLHEQAYDRNPGLPAVHRGERASVPRPRGIQESRILTHARTSTADWPSAFGTQSAWRRRRRREAATVSEVQAERRRVARGGAGALEG